MFRKQFKCSGVKVLALTYTLNHKFLFCEFSLITGGRWFPLITERLLYLNIPCTQ